MGRPENLFVHSSFIYLFTFAFFETVLAGLEVDSEIYLPQPPEPCDYRRVPPRLIYCFETGSQVAQVDLELPTDQRMTLNS